MEILLVHQDTSRPKSLSCNLAVFYGELCFFFAEQPLEDFSAPVFMVGHWCSPTERGRGGQAPAIAVQVGPHISADRQNARNPRTELCEGVEKSGTKVAVKPLPSGAVRYARGFSAAPVETIGSNPCRPEPPRFHPGRESNAISPPAGRPRCTLGLPRRPTNRLGRPAPQQLFVWEWSLTHSNVRDSGSYAGIFSQSQPFTF